MARGNFGTVHLINLKDDISSLFVAKKIDQRDNDQEQKNKAMFEVNLIKNFNHPNIVKFEQFF